MNRAAFLLVCLSLALMSVVPLTAPVAAQQTLPTPFVGRWEGVSAELPTNAQVPVTVDLTGGSLGAVVGTMALPNHACGGDVTLQRVAADGSQVELAVDITFGTACIDGGIVTLTLRADGSVFYDWRHPNVAVTATGTLTRTGGAAAPTTGAPSPADWCAQLALTYAGAPSLSGPWYGPLEQRPGYLTRANAEVRVADFVATAIFSNPTTSTTVPWDYGFAFRQTADQREVQQIIIASNGTWYYAAYPQGVLASGAAPSFNFSPGLPNTLDLVVSGDTASFCLNGEFLSTVQLPPAVTSDVYLATGFFDTTIVSGRLVAYEGFEVWGQ